MFEKPGKTMQSAAVVIGALGLFGAFALALTLSKDRYDNLDFLSFLLIATCGAAVSFVSSLVLYGIGDAIDNISEIAAEARKANMKLDKISELAVAQGKEDTQNVSDETIEHPGETFNLADYIY